jgi:hypothetical protein
LPVPPVAVVMLLQAVELERACLKGLDWRMGPYFNGL